MVLVPSASAVPTPVPVEIDAIDPEPKATEVSGDGQDCVVQLGDWIMGLARSFTVMRHVGKTS
ncbi:MAG: hypothetical protein ACE5JF_02475 [Anaerolineales bacterium]